MKKICFYLILVVLLGYAENVLAQSNTKVNLSLVHTYHFEKGYYNTFIEAEGDSVGLICPNLTTIYIINAKTKTKGHLTFKNGRGPGEISRGPFGIFFGKHSIYLADSDNQRFIVYNFRDSAYKTEIFRNVPFINYIHVFNKNFALSTPKAVRKLAYFLYDPEKKKLVRKYNLPQKSSDPYRFSGIPAVTSNFLVHANRYYGDLILWNKKTAQFIRHSVVMKVSKPDSRKTKFGNFTGHIPPQNPELKFLDIAGNLRKPHCVFLLMKSKNGKYKTNVVYDYDFMKDKVVGTFKLPAKATLLATNKSNLFVYSKNKDAMYQYKLEVK